jgi:hypothetical protein
MNQQSLFEVETAAAAHHCPESETRDSLSRMADNRHARRLATLIDRLQRTNDPLERAKLATRAREVTEQLLEATILDANQAGLTWRDIGAGVGVPFQTLFRRYGANR